MSEAATLDEQVAHNESIIIGDDRLVKVALKIREARAEKARQYEAEDKVLKDQLQQVQNEILRRLVERGADQTKTPYGTAFIGEEMQATIADEETFHAFVRAQDDLTWFHKRVRIERLKEYIAAHGVLPPGINVFRERCVNLRSPRKKNAAGASGPEDYAEGTVNNAIGE